MTRIEKAINVLQNGGYFRDMLEKNSYTNREVFTVRLIDNSNSIVKGVGRSVFFKLEDKLIRDYSCPSFSSFCKIYRLK